MNEGSGLNRKTAGLKLRTFYIKFIRVNSTVVSEAMRLRRICEDKTDYDTSLEYLKNKCFKSKFPKTLTSKIVEQAKSWVDRFHPINNSKLKKNKQKKIVWVT